jgi:hypothetical protein
MKKVRVPTDRPAGHSFNLQKKVNSVMVAVEDDLNYLHIDVRLSWPGEPRALRERRRLTRIA